MKRIINQELKILIYYYQYLLKDKSDNFETKMTLLREKRQFCDKMTILRQNDIFETKRHFWDKNDNFETKMTILRQQWQI